MISRVGGVPSLHPGFGCRRAGPAGLGRARPNHRRHECEGHAGGNDPAAPRPPRHREHQAVSPDDCGNENEAQYVFKGIVPAKARFRHFAQHDLTPISRVRSRPLSRPASRRRGTGRRRPRAADLHSTSDPQRFALRTRRRFAHDEASMPSSAAQRACSALTNASISRRAGTGAAIRGSHQRSL